MPKETKDSVQKWIENLSIELRSKNIRPELMNEILKIEDKAGMLRKLMKPSEIADRWVSKIQEVGEANVRKELKMKELRAREMEKGKTQWKELARKRARRGRRA